MTQTERPAREPSWWHRDHPTFDALSGFFAGMAYVIVVPAVYAVVLGWLFDQSRAEKLFPFVLLGLGVPVGLLVVPRTRRFGGYVAMGVLATVAVIATVTALMLWILLSHDK